jgi:SAM-dependent methyltransferase
MAVKCGELSADQRIVRMTRNILEDHGFSLSNRHTILDFGCGSGRHVYEFRDGGFTAFGFDEGQYLVLRDPADLSFFRFSEGGRNYRVPYEDSTFDLVYSTSVLEHVLDFDAVLSEIGRVLKPDGVSLNYFPSRCRPIEPHIFVPFAGVFQNYYYFLFWAALGIRNSFQRGKGCREVATRNLEYSKTGIRYLRKGEIAASAHRYFKQVHFVEDSYMKHCPGRSGSLYPLAKVLPGFKYLYAALHTRALLLRK